jgi:hypothetical protein
VRFFHSVGPYISNRQLGRQIVIKPYTLEVCFPDFSNPHIAVG